MSTSLSPLLAPMLSSAAMRAVCDDVACLQNMLDFEAALARAEAAVGVIPASAAGPIATACRAESFDLAALAEAATRSGNLAIPLVKALTANVAKADADAARYVHWGATSQDVIDTGAMLGLRAGIDALLADIDRAIAGFAKLARQHRDTAGGRPHLAAARAADAVRAEARRICRGAASLAKRLQRLRSETLALQFGGAAGTLAALGDKGLLVAERLAQELELPLPDAPWHTHRDRIAEAASVFAILAGTCGKIARDREGDTNGRQQRRDDGMAQRRKVLGNEWVDKSVKNRNAFNTDFQDLITRYAWGDIWTRPHFDHRTRRVLVIGTMVALGQWDEFRLHVRAALAEGGFTPDDIKEILLQQAIYCGVPAANHAVKEANAIIAELGLLKG